jgi:hypothetical protein
MLKKRISKASLVAFFSLALEIALGLAGRPAMAADIVYYIAGSPFDYKPDCIVRSLKKLSDFMAAEHPKAHYFSIWNGNWQNACAQIKSMKSEGDKLILVGHSFGAEASLDIGRCLQAFNINVDLAVTLDPMQRFFDVPGDVVPENINLDLSFYETQDFGNRPFRNLHHPDGSSHGIENTEVHIDSIDDGYADTFHDGIVVKLIDDGTIQKLIDEFLSH